MTRLSKSYQVHPGKDYRHFKGKIYKVLYICRDAGANQPMVVYRAQHGDYQVWVRPLAEFTDFIDRNGYRGPRFMEIMYGKD